MNDLYTQWKKDEQAHFEGWDFSYIKDRWEKDKMPWDYVTLAKELVKNSNAVLDMGTGGGEILASLAPLPEHSVAIEGWKLNVAVAKKNLEPLGVKVLEVNESYELPFKNGEFDLVLNRHSAFKTEEVFRILSEGGHFLTQQVGGGNLDDLIAEFDATPKYKDWTLQSIEDDLKSVGFTVADAKEWTGKVRFKDVGAVVYFLKAVPWVVEGFTVDTHRTFLEKLQKRVDSRQKLSYTMVRFLAHANK